jgi:acetoin utilization deacetylase AcuC-like enzyme/GNAT superfamily N-acetyltransferase
MFRIRRIFDDTLAIDQKVIAQVQAILRQQFYLLPEADVQKLPELLRNPLKHAFRAVLFVADDSRGTVEGFALLLHAPSLNFSFLDFLSAAPGTMGRGIGGALYERVREESVHLGVVGVFFECLPDTAADCAGADILKDNQRRLRFYERFGARPIINTRYETPLKSEDRCPPYLVYDDLGRGRPLRRAEARVIVRAILERKYGKACPPGYIDMVVDSFRDDPVELRKPKYGVAPESVPIQPSASLDRKVRLLVSSHHEIHHIKERGYLESPVRIATILKQIETTGLFHRVAANVFPDSLVHQVHDPEFVRYLKTVCRSLKPGEAVYPYVFPIRNVARPPLDMALRAGYYCIDTFTPLTANVYEAARHAADCALTAAHALLVGNRAAYALVRPPGHHAERRTFGGFCYLNSASLAAHYLSDAGRIAILDVDYHHGNGHQNIFYSRSDVLTISIHGHPRFAFPYFSGFEDERGQDAGEGFNVNYPLGESVDGAAYRAVLEKALARIERFRPGFLVAAVGFDPAKADPTGSWSLTAKDFETVGEMIGRLGHPTLVVQEGGYNHRNLGVNARHFFVGLSRSLLSD